MHARMHVCMYVLMFLCSVMLCYVVLCCVVKCNVLVCFDLYEYMHVCMCAVVCMLTIKRIAFKLSIA